MPRAATVLATQNDVAVRITASNQPDRVDEHAGQRFASSSASAELSPGARSYRVSVMGGLPSDRRP